MKQYKIMQAYNATEELSKNDKLSTDVLWAFYKLRKILSEHVEFQREREDAIKNKYVQYVDEDGTIKGQHYVDYINEMNDVLNLDKDINEIKKVKLTLKDGMGITIQMMEALEDFVDFEKE